MLAVLLSSPKITSGYFAKLVKFISLQLLRKWAPFLFTEYVLFTGLLVPLGGFGFIFYYALAVFVHPAEF